MSEVLPNIQNIISETLRSERSDFPSFDEIEPQIPNENISVEPKLEEALIKNIIDLKKLYINKSDIKDKWNPIPKIEEEKSEMLAGFEDVAGQEDAVREARKLVAAINNPEVFAKRGVKRPKGILLYGPPGTGKTMIARAIAKEADAEFLSVSGADVQSKWVNDSTEKMQEVFNRANEIVKSGRKVILFFDEIDAIAPSRTGSGEMSGAHREDSKVVSVMLQNMDGMLANPDVTILAATNRPDIIDSALKRPGRIDKVIEVGLPAKPHERKAILKVHIERAKKVSTEPASLFVSDLDINQLADITNGMSGAELANIINLTLEEKVAQELEGISWTPVTALDLLSRVSPVIQQAEQKRRMGFPVPLRRDKETN